MLSALVRVRGLRAEGVRRELARLQRERETLAQRLALLEEEIASHRVAWRELAARCGVWSLSMLHRQQQALAHSYRQGMALRAQRCELERRASALRDTIAAREQALRLTLRAREKLDAVLSAGDEEGNRRRRR